MGTRMFLARGGGSSLGVKARHHSGNEIHAPCTIVILSFESKICPFSVHDCARQQ